MRFNKFIAGTVTAVMLAGAPAAFAQSSAQQGYSVPGGVVQTQLTHPPGKSTQPRTTTVSTPAPSPAASTSAKTSGKLPFTGFDIALVVGAGGLLMALGFGIRRLSRPADMA